MALFALADPHLAFASDKPMSVFGSRWENHASRIEAAWRESVGDTDTVVLPGDISWAMRLDEALPDLRFLDRLPGHKIIARGNHDYWWSTLARMERWRDDNSLNSLSFLRNNCLEPEPGVLVCGTRGWLLPEDIDFQRSDEAILAREFGRLTLSLEAAAARREANPDAVLVAVMHFPPYGRQGRASGFTRLLEQYHVDRCLYGHVHGMQAAHYERLAPPPGKVRYILTSADCLRFRPLRVLG